MICCCSMAGTKACERCQQNDANKRTYYDPNIQQMVQTFPVFDGSKVIVDREMFDSLVESVQGLIEDMKLYKNYYEATKDIVNKEIERLQKENENQNGTL